MRRRIHKKRLLEDPSPLRFDKKRLARTERSLLATTKPHSLGYVMLLVEEKALPVDTRRPLVTNGRLSQDNQPLANGFGRLSQDFGRLLVRTNPTEGDRTSTPSSPKPLSRDRR
jgi:hypothetical protein